jgi:hypothetical protein
MLTKIFSIAFMVLAVVYYAAAQDASYDTSKDRKSSKEQSIQHKKTIDKKDSTGSRKSTTKSHGVDKTTSETWKAAGQDTSQKSADVSLPLESVFMNSIAILEDKTEPFTSCRIATNPKLLKDFGLSAEISPGVIDVTAADFLAKAAQSNSGLKAIADEKAIINYKNCLAYYGALIGQAYLYLSADVNAGKGSIKSMGYDEFMTLADDALIRALSGITNATIKGLYDRAVNDKQPCQFDKSLENIKCGASVIAIGGSPQLTVSGIKMYGGGFAGYQGTFKVSKSWSYTTALESLKTNSKYAKFAEDVSNYTEELESQGRSREAVLVRKKAVDLAKSGKQAVSPSKLLPQIH